MTMVTTQTAGAVLLAVLLDGWLGEPRRWHPLVGFGRVTVGVEALFHRAPHAGSWFRGRVLGGVAWLLLVALPVLGVVVALPGTEWDWLAEAWLLYLAVGGRSLIQHGEAVREALAREDWAEARVRVGYLVSRETGALSPGAVVSATIESLLENGCDALFGALFWFLVAGAPGAVAYRLVNTLDAMWGYRNPRYLYFGWAAARADDLMNLIPARLTALTYALAGGTGTALRCWFRQGPGWKSPNAGAVMASGAGALGVTLGGPARYHGIDTLRPPLGQGRPPEEADLARTIRLLRRGLLLWGAVVILLWGVGHA